jgi:hypothetical protein
LIDITKDSSIALLAQERTKTGKALGKNKTNGIMI